MPNMKAPSLKAKKLNANKKCDGQTDRRTDGQTDKVIPKWRSALLAPQKTRVSKRSVQND